MTTSTSRYEMQERIATGGMGEVWRARDSVLGRTVAVKVLKREYADDPRFRERFANEARHAASLHHPNIATVFDFGENQADDGGTRPFLVMELVEGRPLSALIDPDRPMDPDRVRNLLRQSAEALAQAHAAGIVHRDVKPANLLVTPDGTVKVTDFGIARAADSVALTGTGEVIGTPHYLSPEQAEGKVATPASDVYALGVVLFECLTGHRPFRGDTPVATALAHLRSPVPELPPDVPEDLAAIVRRSLEKDPDRRYLDAAAFATALGGSPEVFAEPADDTTASMAPPTAVLAAAPSAAAEPEVAATTTVLRDHDRRRLPSWWPLAALAVLGVILLVTAFLSGGGSGTDTPAASPPGRSTSASPSASQSASQSASPSASPSSVASHPLRPADYQGLRYDDAVRKLRALGYSDIQRSDRANSGRQKPDTVASISPTGTVAADQQVVLTVWSAPEQHAPQQGKHRKGHDKGNKK